MALIKNFFKRKPVDEFVEEDISLETLQQLIPIRTLSNEILNAFSLENKAEIITGHEILFSLDEETNSAIYLLKGDVSVFDGKNTYEIKATSNQAKFPLSSGLKHKTTVTAKTQVSILRVSQKIMSLNSEKAQAFELSIPDEFRDSRAFQLFSYAFQENELEIPSLPTIAINLRKAMQKEIGIDEAVKIIQLDSVISAKLIEVANCPLYISITPVKSCFEAVKKIGLKATRNLVISLSISNIFKSNSVLVKKYLNAQWKNSLHLSSLSYVLASISKENNPEEALLAGLVCDIGAIPFLNFVANLPAGYVDEQEIMQIIPLVKGVVGASILQNWGFSDEFIQVSIHSDDWFYYSEGTLSLTDIVILSRLHGKIGKNEMADLPAITSIPAASKLKDISLSPENSLSILHDAKDKINDALKAFSS